MHAYLAPPVTFFAVALVALCAATPLPQTLPF